MFQNLLSLLVWAVQCLTNQNVYFVNQLQQMRKSQKYMKNSWSANSKQHWGKKIQEIVNSSGYDAWKVRLADELSSGDLQSRDILYHHTSCFMKTGKRLFSIHVVKINDLKTGNRSSCSECYIYCRTRRVLQCSTRPSRWGVVCRHDLTTEAQISHQVQDRLSWNIHRFCDTQVTSYIGIITNSSPKWRLTKVLLYL